MRLPILQNRILRPDDACRAMDAGVECIIVANHEGRQIDGAVDALDALAAVSAVVQGRIPLL